MFDNVYQYRRFDAIQLDARCSDSEVSFLISCLLHTQTLVQCPILLICFIHLLFYYIIRQLQLNNYYLIFLPIYYA